MACRAEQLSARGLGGWCLAAVLGGAWGHDARRCMEAAADNPARRCLGLVPNGADGGGARWRCLAAVLRGGKRGKRGTLSIGKLIDDNLPCMYT